MGKMIIAEGEPGTGKSRAILNLDPETTLIIRPNNKDLPFRGGRVMYNKEKQNILDVMTLNQVHELLVRANDGSRFKTIIIEDVTHLMTRKMMKDIMSKGYDKWNELAYEVFYGLLEYEAKLRDDLYVILICHTQNIVDANTGEVRWFLQTPGRLLDNQVKIPSYVTYILHTDVQIENEKPVYRFLTNRDGTNREAKSPEGCLSLYEPNDYKIIIDKIEAYQKGE